MSCKTPVHNERLDITWDTVGLGQRSDNEIAQAYKVDPATVRRHRLKLGIHAFNQCVTPPKRKDIDWEVVGLGCRPDEEIALQLGVHMTTVGYQRRKRGIDPTRKVYDEVPSAFGLYWLGLFAGADWCEVPSCSTRGDAHGVFLLRGHVVSIQLCTGHGKAVETWASKHHPDVITKLVAALRSPSMMRETAYVQA